MRFFSRLSFQAKILLSFALIIVLTLGFGYLFISQAIDRGFEDFNQRNVQVQGQLYSRLLATYYEREGSWDDLQKLFELRATMFRDNIKQRMPHVLADREGVVVVAPDEQLIGQKLSDEELDSGVDIVVSGESVGTFVVRPTLAANRLHRWVNPFEQNFLALVNQSLWLAGLAAGGIALLLSFGLLRHLTIPLRALEQGARQITRGKLDKRVAVLSNDELGRLGNSFNEMAETLEKSERAKRNMINDVAHELRTPLSVLRSGLEGLMDDVLAPTPENFAALHNKTLLLSRLVEDLQQLALADAGQLSVQMQTSPLRPMLARIRATIEVQLEEQKIELIVELPQDLAPILVDVQRIEQVLLNLLSNAVTHTPCGGTIRIVAEELEKTVQISVCDSGQGLSEEDLAHAFDRFYRADKSRARASGGSGLGLAITKALVEAHGQQIWAENAAEGGACFHFTVAKAG